MWYSRPAQTALNLFFAIQEKSIPNSALAIVASAILKSEVNDMRDCDFPVFRQPFLPILLHEVVVNQALDMLFRTPAVVLIGCARSLHAPCRRIHFGTGNNRRPTGKPCWSPTHGTSGATVHPPFPPKIKKEGR